MTMLWPSMPLGVAQQNLRQTLYLLRHTVQTEETPPFIHSDRYTISWNPDAPLFLDVTQFYTLAKSQDALDWQRAVDLYRGEFLVDFYLPDSEPFEAWAANQRALYYHTVKSVLALLTDHYLAQKEWKSAEAVIRRHLDLDNLQEGVHRQLIEVLYRSGHREEAIIHFDMLRKLLFDELALETEAETNALINAIRSGNLAETPSLAIDQKKLDFSTRGSQYPAIRHNIPHSLTSLIGRENELMKLNQLLQDPDVHLVTILGAGGIGKTRLVIAYAEEVIKNISNSPLQRSRFPDGIYFVSLTSQSNRESLVATLAEILAFPIRSSATEVRPPEKQVLNYLRDKNALLIFDNFEQLKDSSDLIHDLLETAPGLQILVTSRERLYLTQENLFPILGLEFPMVDNDQACRSYAAVRLFLHAARRIHPDFGATDAELRNVAKFCRFVEGMPLAIELAASWVDTLSMVDILNEAERNLSILETTMRDLPPKHRSFRAAMDTSWSLMSPDEQTVFCQLTIFQRRFSREAAQAIAIKSDGTAVSLKMLARLVNKSWLHYRRHEDIYQIHELIRQYGAEKCSHDLKQQTSVHDRHAQYFCTFLSQRKADLRGNRQTEALAEIETVWEEIQRAWRWAIQKGLLDLVEEAMFSLGCFYWMQGRVFDGECAFERAVKMITDQSSSGEKRVRILAMLLTWQAGFCSDSERANLLLDKATSMLETISHPSIEDIRWEMAFINFTYGLVGTKPDARTFGERSLKLFQEIGDPWGIAAAYNLLGQIDFYASNYMGACQNIEECLRFCRSNGNKFGAIDSLIRLCRISIEQGDFRKAERLIREGLAMDNRLANGGSSSVESLSADKILVQFSSIQRAWPSPGDLNIADVLGQLMYRSGRYSEAYRVAQESIVIEERLGNRDTISWWTITLGFLSLHLGDYAGGYRLAEAGLALCYLPGMGEAHRIRWALQVMGIAELMCGAFESAKRRLQESFATIMDIGTLAYLGGVEFMLEDYIEAYKNLIQVLQISVTYHKYCQLLESLPFIALVLAKSGNLELAVEVHAMACQQPMIGNSHYFADIAGTKLEEAARALPAHIAEAAMDRGRNADLWKRAADLLAEFNLPPEMQ